MDHSESRKDKLSGVPIQQVSKKKCRSPVKFKQASIKAIIQNHLSSSLLVLPGNNMQDAGVGVFHRRHGGGSSLFIDKDSA